VLATLTELDTKIDKLTVSLLALWQQVDIRQTKATGSPDWGFDEKFNVKTKEE
jgi:hypothetical protein